MNLLDIVIVLCGLSAAATGYHLGFLTRVGSWGGALLGIGVGAWIAPKAVDLVGGPTIIRLAVGLLVILVAVGIGGSIGEAVGSAVRRGLPRDAIPADRAGGAVAGVAGVLVVVWLLSPVLAEVPGVVARQSRESAVTSFVETITPRPPDPLQTLSDLVGGTRFPRVFEDLQPAPDTGRPPAAGGVSSGTISAATASTVRIDAVGCGGIHHGSGFAVAADTVVTNAHVVAGAREVEVRRPDGERRSAQVVVFDDDRDLAVLRVPDLGQRPLDVANGAAGMEGVVIGYPGGQARPRVAPARIRNESPTVGYDIYGDDRVRRKVLFLAASLRQGDSGSPLVNPAGDVVGVAFAIAPDRSTTAYALDDSELRAVLAAPRRPTTGRCQ